MRSLAKGGSEVRVKDQDEEAAPVQKYVGIGIILDLQLSSKKEAATTIAQKQIRPSIMFTMLRSDNHPLFICRWR